MIRWRATRRAGQVQVLTRSGNTATPDETWSAWSKPYTNADGEQIAQPERAVPAVARGAERRQGHVADPDVGHRRLSSAQSAARGRDDHRSPARDRVSAPVLDAANRRLPDSRTTRPTAARRPDAGRPRRAAAAAPAARPPYLSEGPADDRLEGGGRQRRSHAVRRLVPARRGNGVEGAEAGDLGSDFRLGHDVGSRRDLRRARSPRRTRRRMRRRRALTGEKESVSFDIDNTAAADRGAARDAHPAQERPSRSRCATSSRPCSASSTRSTRAAGVWSIPKDGIPDSRREEFEVAVDESENGRNVIIRATDAMNNVATAVAAMRLADVRGRDRQRSCRPSA